MRKTESQSRQKEPKRPKRRRESGKRKKRERKRRKRSEKDNMRRRLKPGTLARRWTKARAKRSNPRLRKRSNRRLRERKGSEEGINDLMEFIFSDINFDKANKKNAKTIIKKETDTFITLRITIIKPKTDTNCQQQKCVTHYKPVNRTNSYHQGYSSQKFQARDQFPRKIRVR
jgi:hypothetical protein